MKGDSYSAATTAGDQPGEAEQGGGAGGRDDADVAVDDVGEVVDDGAALVLVEPAELGPVVEAVGGGGGVEGAGVVEVADAAVVHTGHGVGEEDAVGGEEAVGAGGEVLEGETGGAAGGVGAGAEAEEGEVGAEAGDLAVVAGDEDFTFVDEAAAAVVVELEAAFLAGRAGGAGDADVGADGEALDLVETEGRDAAVVGEEGLVLVGEAADGALGELLAELDAGVEAREREVPGDGRGRDGRAGGAPHQRR